MRFGLGNPGPRPYNAQMTAPTPRATVPHWDVSVAYDPARSILVEAETARAARTIASPVLGESPICLNAKEACVSPPYLRLVR